MNYRPLFALDQAFPLTLADPKFWPNVDLRPLGILHPDLVQDHDDWEVLCELKLRGGVDGFVTLDQGMLNLPKEMAILQQTKLTLVVVEEGGSDPLVATGLLMVYMPQIIKRFDPKKAQLWRLRQGEKKPESPWDQLRSIAVHQNVPVRELYRRVRLPYGTFT